MFNRGCVMEVLTPTKEPSVIPIFNERNAKFISKEIKVLSIKTFDEKTSFGPVCSEFDPKIIFKPGETYKGRFVVFLSPSVAKNSTKIPQRKFIGFYSGWWKKYHDNGALFSKGYYYMSSPTGEFHYYDVNQKVCRKEEFYNTGLLKSSGRYSDDKKTGIWSFYEEDGSVKELVNYGDYRVEPPTKRTKMA